MTISPIPATIVNVVEIKPTEKNTNNSIINFCGRYWRKIVSEIMATLLLVLFGCMSTIPIDGVVSPSYAAFGFGLAVMINVQIFAHISGAYMNPALTLAGVIWGNIPVGIGVVYAIAQCVGAILGYGILMNISPVDAVSEGVCVSAPHPNFNDYQALGVELMLTAGLSFITCAIWDPINKERQDSAAIKFGLAIAGLALAGAPLTGSSMNPARSLGPALWTGRWGSHWVYWVGPLVGGGAAAVIYKYIWLNINK